MGVFTFAILSLAAYRFQRIVTKDDWPPSRKFRVWLYTRFGKDSAWFDLFTCPWCFGTWLTAALFLEYRYLQWIPMWVYTLIAASAVVGFLAERES